MGVIMPAFDPQLLGNLFRYGAVSEMTLAAEFQGEVSAAFASAFLSFIYSCS